jgi:hypothetical protein
MVTFPHSTKTDIIEYLETHDDTTFSLGEITRPQDNLFAQGSIGGSLMFTGKTSTHVLQYTWKTADNTIYEHANIGDGDGIFDENWPLVVYFPHYKFILTRGLNTKAEVFGWDAGAKKIQMDFESAYVDLPGTLTHVEPVFVNNKMYIYQEGILDGGSDINVIGEMTYVYPGTTKTTIWAKTSNNNKVTSMASTSDAVMFTYSNNNLY